MITRSVLFSLKCTRNRLAAGLCPDPLGEIERSPRPHSRNRGLGPRKGGEGREWEGRDRKGGNWKDGMGIGRGKERERKGGGKKGGEEKGRGGERKGRKSSSPNVKLAVDATVHS